MLSCNRNDKEQLYDELPVWSSCGLERSSTSDTPGGRASRIVTNCTFLNAILVVYCPLLQRDRVLSMTAKSLHPPTSGTKAIALAKRFVFVYRLAEHRSPRLFLQAEYWEKKSGRSVNQNISLFCSRNVLSIHVTSSLAKVKIKFKTYLYPWCIVWVTLTRGYWRRQFAKTQCDAGCNVRNRNFLSNAFG